jgi:hypothetical protein
MWHANIIAHRAFTRHKNRVSGAAEGQILLDPPGVRG